MRPRKSIVAFSFVELLGVVLVLAVVAMAAVPLYMNTRKTAAARACKANIAAIASAEAAYALRNNLYTNLVTLASSQPEGLASSVTCPLDHQAYVIKRGSVNGQDVNAAGATARIWISCPNTACHSSAINGSSSSDWQRTMAAIGSDTQP